MKKIIIFYIIILVINYISYTFLSDLVNSEYLVSRKRIFFTDKSFNQISTTFLAFCVFIPILEELSFRAFLSMNKKVVILGVSFLLVSILFKLLEIFIKLNFWLDVSLTFFIALLLFTYLTKPNHIRIQINYNLICNAIFSSIIFALFHTGINYTSDSLYFSLLSVLPFFTTGLVFCFIRIKHGLIYSIVLHSLVNFTGLLFSI